MISLLHSVSSLSDSIRDVWPSINMMVMTHDKRRSFWSIIIYQSPCCIMTGNSRKSILVGKELAQKYSKRNAMQSSRKTVDSRPRRYQLLYPSLYWIKTFTNLMFPIHSTHSTNFWCLVRMCLSWRMSTCLRVIVNQCARHNTHQGRFRRPTSAMLP